MGGLEAVFEIPFPAGTVLWCRFLKRGACPYWGLLHFPAAAYIEGYVWPP